MNSRPDIELSLLGLSKIYNYELSEPLVEIWINLLQDLTTEELNNAVRVYILDAKNVYFPKPGQIYSIARPENDTENEANYVANMIISAVRRFGKYQSHLARAHLGDEIWAVVALRGGWDGLCNSEMDTTETLIAQLRGTAKVLLARKKSGASSNLRIENSGTRTVLGFEMKSLK